jgi:hypothetical protein
MLDLKALLDDAKAIRPDVTQVVCRMACAEGYASVRFYAYGKNFFTGGGTEAELLDSIRQSVQVVANA